MIPVKHIDPEDLPLYAMQLLPQEEYDELTLHLQHSPEARRLLAEIQGDLAALALSSPMESPPAAARQRLMKHVAREKKPVPIQLAPVANYAGGDSASLDEEVQEPGVLVRFMPWLGWAAAAGIAFSAFYMFDQNKSLRADLATQKTAVAKLTQEAQTTNLVVSTLQDPAATRVTLVEPAGKPAPQGRASYDSEKGSLVFLASNLDPLDPYHTYELWLIPADGRDPIPAGTFKSDRRGYAIDILPMLPKGVAAKGFAVSIEDEGGAPQPAGPIVLKGATS